MEGSTLLTTSISLLGFSQQEKGALETACKPLFSGTEKGEMLITFFRTVL
jgi:hypothetical protein